MLRNVSYGSQSAPRLPASHKLVCLVLLLVDLCCHICQFRPLKLPLFIPALPKPALLLALDGRFRAGPLPPEILFNLLKSTSLAGVISEVLLLSHFDWLRFITPLPRLPLALVCDCPRRMLVDELKSSVLVLAESE